MLNLCSVFYGYFAPTMHFWFVCWSHIPKCTCQITWTKQVELDSIFSQEYKSPFLRPRAPSYTFWLKVWNYFKPTCFYYFREVEKLYCSLIETNVNSWFVKHRNLQCLLCSCLYYAHIKALALFQSTDPLYLPKLLC